MKTRIYIAGGMTGLPDFNYPAFHAAAAQLRALGFDAVNPAEDGLPVESPWEAHLKVAIAKLVTCDAVAVLDGWARSRGAVLETNLANDLGMPCHSLAGWVEWFAGTADKAQFDKTFTQASATA